VVKYIRLSGILRLRRFDSLCQFKNKHEQETNTTTTTGTGMIQAKLYRSNTIEPREPAARSEDAQPIRSESQIRLETSICDPLQERERWSARLWYWHPETYFVVII